MSLAKYLSQVVSQLQGLTELLDDNQYTSPLPILSGASIGKHTRHIIEAFQTVVDGIDAERVSFDWRKRETQLERERAFARQRLSSIQSQLLACDLSKQVVLMNDFAYEEGGAATPTETTLQRELIYALEHAIHHMAMIKVGVVHSYGIDIAPEFGVAPSTIRYMKKQGVHK